MGKAIEHIRRRYFLIAILVVTLLAGVIRFNAIQNFPVSLYWDEAAIGYNAYSILQTGKDEYGKLLPLLFTSYNDYKSPGYIYLTALSVKAFGLNEFSIRFTSAFLGTLTVLCTGLLVVSLLGFLNTENEYTQKSHGYLYKKRKTVGIIAAFLLTISPWHIQFSRAGFEANAGLFFIVLGSWLFISGIKKISSRFILSLVSFALSFYFYRSLYIVTPLLISGFFLFFRVELWNQKTKKSLWAGIVLFILILLPFLPSMFSKDGMIRAEQTNVISTLSDQVTTASKRQNELKNVWWSKIIYNRRVVYAQAIVGNYVSNFSPDFLFFQGDANPRHRTNGFGVLYPWEIPFILLGMFLVIRLPSKIRNILFLWIVISPIPSSITTPAPHALRTLNMLPMPQILVALAIVYCCYFFPLRIKIVYLFVLIGIIGFFSLRYAMAYPSSMVANGQDWADGYKQLTHYVFQNEKKYNKVIITGHYWQPYMYFLVYKKYDPTLFQQNGSKQGFATYFFGGTKWDGGEELGKVNLRSYTKANEILVALSPEEYKEQQYHVHVLKNIVDHAGRRVFIVCSVN